LGHELTYILRGNRIYKKLPQAEVEAKRKAEHDRQMAELEEWKAELAKLREESIAGSHFNGWLYMLPTFIKVSLGGLRVNGREQSYNLCLPEELRRRNL
jgi:hypothetical protein